LFARNASKEKKTMNNWIKDDYYSDELLDDFIIDSQTTGNVLDFIDHIYGLTLKIEDYKEG
jgi:hypothetical protein